MDVTFPPRHAIPGQLHVARCSIFWKTRVLQTDAVHVDGRDAIEDEHRYQRESPLSNPSGISPSMGHTDVDMLVHVAHDLSFELPGLRLKWCSLSIQIPDSTDRQQASAWMRSGTQTGRETRVHDSDSAHLSITITPHFT
ncbi:hypothetical protein OIU79_030104 [Salix purpurea]|uniref:Uncharacterized protein n=1 Tax=Salix purpurea TaxID=77065 RepID=A0A9Q0VKB1_SALPP|nr:hypothetical protein OIU79_030104 [Salix purpurea]